MGAILVAVAARTGRALHEIARESYALTLYTAWHLQDLDDRLRMEREGERYDAAALNVAAYHQPKELQSMHARFLSRLQGRPAETSDAATARYARIVERMQGARFVALPIERR